MVRALKLIWAPWPPTLERKSWAVDLQSFRPEKRLFCTRMRQKGMTAATKTYLIQVPTQIPKGLVHGSNHPECNSWPSRPMRQVNIMERSRAITDGAL